MWIVRRYNFRWIFINYWAFFFLRSVFLVRALGHFLSDFCGCTRVGWFGRLRDDLWRFVLMVCTWSYWILVCQRHMHLWCESSGRFSQQRQHIHSGCYRSQQRQEGGWMERGPDNSRLSWLLSCKVWLVHLYSALFRYRRQPWRLAHQLRLCSHQRGVEILQYGFFDFFLDFFAFIFPQTYFVLNHVFFRAPGSVALDQELRGPWLQQCVPTHKSIGLMS